MLKLTFIAIVFRNGQVSNCMRERNIIPDNAEI